MLLEDKVLTVKSPAHKGGRRWSPSAAVTSNTIDGVTGRIEWIAPGGVLVVR